jgi:HK97 family phage major capsid protein
MGREFLASVEDVQRYSEKELAEKLSEFDDVISRLRAAPHVDPRERGRKLLELTAFRAAMEEEQRLRSTPTGGARGAQIHGPRADGGFGSFGEQLRAVALAGMPGQAPDPRLFRAAATGLSEAVPSEGGFLLQENFAQEIYQASFEVGKLAKLCRRVPLTQGNSLKIPGLDETSRAAGSRHGGVRSYWIAEADEKIASRPKFRQIELVLRKAVVLTYATDELLSDASALESYIKKVAVDELAFTLDDAILNGTGAGQPLGILNAGALVTQAAEGGQTTGILLENVSKMWSRLLPSSRAQAVWLIGTGVEPALYTMSLSVGTGGGPVFLPAGGASASPFMTLFGRPIIPCEQCAALNTVGDIVLADFSNGFVLAEKAGGIEAAMSIHVRFIYDESVFRFVLRVDGQPALASAVTPFKGGANFTQSHFVALATRG